MRNEYTKEKREAKEEEEGIGGEGRRNYDSFRLRERLRRLNPFP